MSHEPASKVALVTGANTGIGRVTAEELARRGYRVYLAGRSAERTQPVVEAIHAAGGDARFLPLDLADLDSVRRCAAAFLATDEPLHLLVNNAGLAGQRGTVMGGMETHFGVNHLGPFLLTNLLLPRLRESAPARVVVVASRAHKRVRGLDLQALTAPTKTLTGFQEYAVSKLANVLFVRALARRLEGSGVTAYAVHPGVIASDIWRRVPAPARWLVKLFMKSNEEGARTSLHCATAPELAGVSGRYYEDSAERRPSRTAQDDALAETLWHKSAEWTGLGAP